MIYSAEGSEIEFPANDRCLFRLLVVLYQAVADGACRGGVCRCIPRVLVFVAEMRSEWA